MRDSTLRTLVIGEALIDVVEVGSSAPREYVGGSPANVAFGLGALEHPVTLATWIGQDPRGRLIADRCEKLGVDLASGSDAAAHTSVARAVLDAAGHARYDFDLTWQVPPVDDTAAFGHLHTGSIGATLQPGGAQVLHLVQQARGSSTISYDPNIRPTLMGTPDEVRPQVEELIALSDVVKASDEDIAWLYPDQFVPDVLRLWGTWGTPLTVITRGDEGALFALSHVGGVATCPARAATVADTVGAGDSFMAGLISGLLDAGLLGGPAARERLQAARLAEVRPAVERAVAASGATVEHAGAYHPSRDEL